MKRRRNCRGNQKGFTLIELIAVIVILAIIATLAVVSVASIRGKVNEREYFNLASTIEAAARGYAEDTGVNKMFVQTLVDKGLVESDDETKQVYDPRDHSSLNCQIVNYDNGEAKLGDDKNAVCDTTLLSDESIKIQYTLGTDGAVAQDLPNDHWFNQSITLSVVATGVVDLNLDDATFKWTSPLAPDESYSERELTIDDKYVDDTFQVTVTSKGKKYTAYGKVRIDKEPPKVYNFIDTEPEDWTPNKKLQFELSDAESGLMGYQITYDNTTEPTTWVQVNPTGKKNDKINITQNLSSLHEGEYIYVWVKDVVGNVNKSELNPDEDGALQIENIDGIFDTVTLKGSTASGTYVQSVGLTGTIQDLKSGAVGYLCSNSKTAPDANSSQWKKITRTNAVYNVTCNAATTNGEYYLHAIDAVGNIGTATYKVDNIDNAIDDFKLVDTQSSNGYRETSLLRGTAIDSKSGIVGYAFTTSASRPSFTRITATTSQISYTYTATSNTTYYFHVLDGAGNWSYDYVTVRNLVRETSTRKRLYSESTSRINSSVSVPGAISITDYYTDNGSISVSLSGSTAYIYASGGYADSDWVWDTCTRSARSYYADSETVCRTTPRCNYGGRLSGDWCVANRGQKYSFKGNSSTWSYGCSGGKVYKKTGKWPGTPCYENNYDRDPSGRDVYGCSHSDPSSLVGKSCPPTPSSINYYCYAYCYWQGDYKAQCTGGTKIEYSCDYGDYLSGSKCYYCSNYSDWYNSRTGMCEYDCKEYYDYWEYNVTIYYYVLR